MSSFFQRIQQSCLPVFQHLYKEMMYDQIHHLQSGVTVPEETKILIGEVTSVDLSEEFAHEKLSPVLAMYKAEDFEDALSKAEHLIADGDNFS